MPSFIFIVHLDIPKSTRPLYSTHDLRRQMSGGTPDLSNPNVAAAMAVLQKKMPGMMGGAPGGTSASAATEEEDIPEFNANEGDDVD